MAMVPIDPEKFPKLALPLPRLFDTHNHLPFTPFDGDRQAAWQRATAVGVERMIAIGSGEGVDSGAKALDFARQHDGVYASVGLHPHNANLWSADLLAHFAPLSAGPKMVAVGEIGLDFHYDFATPANQHAAFEAQLAWAQAINRPAIIHTRAAHSETLRHLRNFPKLPAAAGVIIHCFSEGESEADAYLGLGCHLSFSGVVTFPKSLALQQVAKRVPAPRLLIETDAPYLTPHPQRGRRNEPACLIWTATFLAELLGKSLTEFAELTYGNACRIFRV